MTTNPLRSIAVMGTALSLWAAGLDCAGAATWDELKVQREPMYSFVEKPNVTRHGDQVKVAFETKGFCDVTVAIENEQGKIIRHLLSGVLGPKAPRPFRKNSKKQVVVWDGKNDKGQYVDYKNSLTVRVSLGLKPQFERSLYWSPYKRTAEMAPLIQATEEGVFVYDGWGVDSVKMFDHAGKYSRSVYPFPATKLNDVKGLCWFEYPQGRRLPLKHYEYQQTFLLSGTNARIFSACKGPLPPEQIMQLSGVKPRPGQTTVGPYKGELGGYGFEGCGALALAARGNHLALAFRRLSRLGTDGSSGGLPLTGAKTCVTVDKFKQLYKKIAFDIGPSSAAISPDGKWLYLSGYAFRRYANWDCLSVVTRMRLDGTEDAKVFLGKVEVNDGGYAAGHGSNPGEFKNATSVDCDSTGRVYVSDFMNDRVQVFTSEGQFLKTISCRKPSLVRINRRNDEVYVFSWRVNSWLFKKSKVAGWIDPSVSRFDTFASGFKALGTRKLPIPKLRSNMMTNGDFTTGLFYTAEIDPWAEPLSIWLGMECRNDMDRGEHPGNGALRTAWDSCGPWLLQEKDGKLAVVRDFGQETVKSVVRAKPPFNAIQRIVVNPATGKLYIGEPDSGPTGKAFCSLLEIDPETGGCNVIELPFNPVEYTFDLDGNIYLRNTDMIARYEFPSLREIPWDYGTERARLGGDGGIGGRISPVISGLEMPSKWPVCYHQGGIHVSHKGHVVASCAWRQVKTSRKHWQAKRIDGAGSTKPYAPSMYPGRVQTSKSPCIHVWDKHGKLVYEDAVPGIEIVDGVRIDGEDNLYVMHNSNQIKDGKPYPNPLAQTLMKFKPGKSKFIAGATKCTPIPLSKETRPKRPPDGRNCFMGKFWIENGPEWSYAGVGKGSSNVDMCCCWFPRFELDDFARSIAPEPAQYSVAMLDSAGNLILRIGQYGNVDDGGPKTKGGSDGVALFHPWYVATHTDRRVFIADPGNGRIASVKLGYHEEVRVNLKDVAEASR